MPYVLHTDGGCSPNPGPGGWAFVLGGGPEPVERFGGEPASTNNRMELTAVIEGLQAVIAMSENQPPTVELIGDSQYVLKGLTEWRKGWERKGWRNSKGEAVANLPLWQRLFAIADARKVTTRWVRGHNGDTYNEQADALANEALRVRGSQG